MIEITDLDYRYKGSRKNALSGISAKLTPGMYLLAGENGAGKTTLLHVLAGLAHPQHGECRIDDAKADSVDPGDMGNVFLLEENMYFPGKSIRDFAQLHSRFYPDFSESQFTKNLQAFGQSGVEPLRSLSLGNLKKAQLAYVLALGVKVLLLDEPTNALDIEGREIFRKLLLNAMKEDSTVIVSTHNVPDLEKLFDGAMIMQGSKLLFAGKEEDVAEKLTFEYSGNPDSEALYSENQSGRYMNVYPADGEEETRVDWRTLYKALHSDKSTDILAQLQSRK